VTQLVEVELNSKEDLEGKTLFRLKKLKKNDDS
jgi:hypothetical protein